MVEGGRSAGGNGNTFQKVVRKTTHAVTKQ